MLSGMMSLTRSCCFGLMGLLWLGAAARGEVDIATALSGTWSLTENHRAVDDPANARQFTVERVMLNATRWSDGQFDLRWAADAAPLRGYFSLQTGRVWVKSPRHVHGRRTGVEYSGTLQWRDALGWSGLAYTDGRRESWGFEAVRISP